MLSSVRFFAASGSATFRRWASICDSNWMMSSRTREPCSGPSARRRSRLASARRSSSAWSTPAGDLSQMKSPSRQGQLERSGEIDVLAAPQAKRQAGTWVVEEWDYRLLILQGRSIRACRPTDLPRCLPTSRTAGLRNRVSLLDLRVPVLSGRDVAAVEPGRYVGWSASRASWSFKAESPRRPGIADEVVTDHRPSFFGAQRHPTSVGDPTLIEPSVQSVEESQDGFQYIGPSVVIQWHEVSRSPPAGKLA